MYTTTIIGLGSHAGRYREYQFARLYSLFGKHWERIVKSRVVLLVINRTFKSSVGSLLRSCLTMWQSDVTLIGNCGDYWEIDTKKATLLLITIRHTYFSVWKVHSLSFTQSYSWGEEFFFYLGVIVWWTRANLSITFSFFFNIVNIRSAGTVPREY